MYLKAKLGPPYKYGEPTKGITINIPLSTLEKIPGDGKREAIVDAVIQAYGIDNPQQKKEGLWMP